MSTEESGSSNATAIPDEVVEKQGEPRREKPKQDAADAVPGKKEPEAAPAPSAPSKQGLLARLGLDLPTLILMIKGGLPPTIGISLLQATPIADYFGTLGYLLGILTILGFAILPRGKFIQSMVLNVLFACVGAAMGMLVLWSSLQARLHTQTTPLDSVTGLPTYNSSQSAVSAIWLFANIWFVNMLRAKFPTLNTPAIVYSILVNISCSFSPLVLSNAEFELIIKRIITAMLSAFAITTAVSLLFFPVPSRAVTFGQMKAIVGLIRKAVGEEKAYLQSLEREDMFAMPHDVSAAVDSKEEPAGKSDAKKSTEAQANTMAEAKILKATIAGMRELAGKLQADLSFARRDVCWSKLDPEDLTTIFELLRAIIVPIIGISTVIDLFQRVAERRNWVTSKDTSAEVIAEKLKEKRLWNEVMRQLHDPFETLSEVVNQGIEHAALQLEIIPRPKVSKKAKKSTQPNATDDVEANGGLVQPGDSGFSNIIEEKVTAIKNIKGSVLQTWAQERGLISDENLVETLEPSISVSDEWRQDHDQSQLFMLLYLEKLMEESGMAIQNFIAFADEKVASGAMKRNRLIVPSMKRLRSWLVSIFEDEDSSAEAKTDIYSTGMNVVYVGDGFAAKKDPEHLPATNAWERFGNGIRLISKFIGSDQSAFGFRVACATMCIGIINFLEPTQQFFQRQRLVWAMIIVSMSMTETSGQSIFGFLLRVGGTLVAMILGLISWYIVDQKTPGVIVFMFLFISMIHYFVLKYPQFTGGSAITMVTIVLIIGYELQVLKIGIEVSESSGQPYYPTYELAPYRLATVTAGALVAFIWTYFPSPVTERTWLRRDLAVTMYLLAHYFTAINQTTKSRLNNTAGDPDDETSPAYQLSKTRQRLFGKLLLILPSLNQHANFQRFEPTIGGRFPRETYLDIIQRATRITSYLTLMAHTVTLSSRDTDTASDSAWIDALSDVLADVSVARDNIICTLALLSNSLQTGHPLPPKIQLPRPFELTRLLRSQARTTGSGGVTSDRGRGRSQPLNDLLHPRNMNETGYAEFAVLQVCSLLVCDDLEGLIKSVSQLVGIVDFSYRIEGSVGSLPVATAAAVAAPSFDSDGGRNGKGKLD
ncbi:hypothetical protein BX600DRAFT_379553 [Xylariales sp. PMI_506]|nr:hypothetical protein BX600DRAFT_379553 [Xylariales sp. PMI_506]